MKCLLAPQCRNCNNYEPHLLNSPLLTAADGKKAEKIPTTKFGKAFYTFRVICHRGLHKSPIFSRFQLAFFCQFGGQLLLYSIMSQARACLFYLASYKFSLCTIEPNPFLLDPNSFLQKTSWAEYLLEVGRSGE